MPTAQLSAGKSERNQHGAKGEPDGCSGFYRRRLPKE